MPKNTKGGKGYKKKKSKMPTGPGKITRPDDEQLYGIVLKRLGNGWVDLIVCDNRGEHVQMALGRVRGILRKRRVPFFPGSYVIACTRSFESTGSEDRIKVDIIHRYYDEHVRILVCEGRIPLDMRNRASVVGGASGLKSNERGEILAGDSGDEYEIVFASEDGSGGVDDSLKEDINVRRILDDADIDDM